MRGGRSGMGGGSCGGIGGGGEWGGRGGNGGWRGGKEEGGGDSWM